MIVCPWSVGGPRLHSSILIWGELLNGISVDGAWGVHVEGCGESFMPSYLLLALQTDLMCSAQVRLLEMFTPRHLTSLLGII